MSKELIAYLKLFHGAYNTAVIMLFLYQGIIGMKIRKSDSKPFHLIKRHRKVGPVAALLGIAGFIAGATIVFLSEGHVFEHPPHFLTGLAIVALIVTTYIISGKIKGPEPYWRNRHFVIGLFIICLYFVQALLGLGILL